MAPSAPPQSQQADLGLLEAEKAAMGLAIVQGEPHLETSIAVAAPELAQRLGLLEGQESKVSGGSHLTLDALQLAAVPPLEEARDDALTEEMGSVAAVVERATQGWLSAPPVALAWCRRQVMSSLQSAIPQPAVPGFKGTVNLAA